MDTKPTPRIIHSKVERTISNGAAPTGSFSKGGHMPVVAGKKHPQKMEGLSSNAPGGRGNARVSQKGAYASGAPMKIIKRGKADGSY